jgi:hypothetical protein
LIAGKVTLAWNPNPDPTVAGYMLHCGVVSHAYVTALDAGAATTTVVEGLVPGITYFFAVSAYNASGIEGPLSDELATQAGSVPVILVQPPSLTILAGMPALLFVDAFGAPPITFQWFLGVTPLFGATNSVLFLPQVSTANAGNYTVVVSGSGGSVTSAAAIINVLNPVASLRPANGDIGSTNDAGSGFLTADRAVKASPPASVASAAGTYNGLFYETDSLGQPTISLQSTGALNQCVVDSEGNFNGTIFLSGQSNSFSGAFDSSGNGSTTVSRSAEGLSDLAVALHLNLGSSLEMTGTISSLDPGNSWSSSLIAEPETNSVAQSPDFLLTLPLTNGMQGGSIVGLGTDGGFSLYGVLGDGTRVQQNASISVTGDIPLFIPLNNPSGLGLIAGWINLSANTPTTPLVWIRPSNEFRAGFTNVLQATLATFSASDLDSESSGE